MTNKSKKAVSAMSDDEFDSRFPNEKAAIDWFINMRYKGNLVCPRCESTVSICRERERLKVFHCSHCNYSFSPIKGTIFEKTHIEIRKWFRVIKNLLNDRGGYSACRVQRDVARVILTKDEITGAVTKEFKEITYTTARRMLMQIRTAMENREIAHIFEGVIEVDETYHGGKPRRTNAILDEKENIIKPSKFYHKRGRGTDKIPIVGVKERSTGHVYAEVMLPNEGGQELASTQLFSVIDKVCKEQPEDMPEKKIVVNTDGFRGYDILDTAENKKKYIHVKVIHSKKQYYKEGGIHTNGIENFWGVIKNGVRGVYHHISLKYLQKYADEYSFKQNTRLDTNMFDILLGQCILPQSKRK
jgi:transposase-like protein